MPRLGKNEIQRTLFTKSSCVQLKTLRLYVRRRTILFQCGEVGAMKNVPNGPRPLQVGGRD
jgi:hypothetical protein